MPWFKVDDTLAFHAKAVAAGNAAMGLWLRAGSWSAQQLTEGFVPDHMISAMSGTKSAPTLVHVRLWDRVEGGYAFRGWVDYQPTREQVEAEREAAKVRQQRARDKAKQKREEEASRRDSRRDGGVTDGVTHGVVTAVVTGPPTRPDPTYIKNTSSEIADAIPDEQQREDVERVCRHLQAKIVENGSKRPNVTKKWRDAARLLIDRDGRTEQQIMTAIDWCQADSFWKANILSMPTLREKYDQLRLKAQEQRDKTQAAPLRAVPEPFTPEPPPPEIADDPEACERWYTDQYARRSA